MLMKPAHGAKCNGCGLCCMDQRCPLAIVTFGDGDRCPALEHATPGYACGLVNNPVRYAPDIVRQHGTEKASAAAMLLIGGGLGCDALEPGEPRNEEWVSWAIDRMDQRLTTSAQEIWNL